MKLTNYIKYSFFDPDDASSELKSHLSKTYANFLMGADAFKEFKEFISLIPKSSLGPEIDMFIIKYAGSLYIMSEKIEPDRVISFSKFSKKIIEKII